MKAPIRVMIVEDSLAAQKLLVKILSQDKQIEVVAIVSSGEEALAQLAQISPDLITMDVHLPGIDGLAVTRQIMETRPVPIIVVSASCLVEDVERAYQLIEAGALAAVAKPISIGREDFQANSARLIQTIKDMAAVKVVKRWPRAGKTDQSIKVADLFNNQINVVAIGASTGGPPVIEAILKDLPSDYPAAILLVQHIAPGFLAGMVEWLQHSLKLKVKVADDGEELQNGTVYLSPEDYHLGMKTRYIALSKDQPQQGHRPSVSFLFQSLADNKPADCLALLLTGMGKDGAAELLALRQKGGITIAQDKESSVVHGMPGAAIELGAACHVMKPAGIAVLLSSLNKLHV